MQKGNKILHASMGCGQRKDDGHLAQAQCGSRNKSPLGWGRLPPRRCTPVLLLTALLEKLAHQSFFTNIAVALMLNAKPRLFGQRLGILPDLIPQRLSPTGVFKITDALDPQTIAYPIGIADTWDGADDLGRMPLGEKFHDRPPVEGLPVYIKPRKRLKL
jgi:hypothetical protein